MTCDGHRQWDDRAKSLVEQQERKKGARVEGEQHPGPSGLGTQ